MGNIPLGSSSAAARRTVPRVSFAVGADEYDRFMGRYSAPLAPMFADFAGVMRGQRVLDVGCGPGALTHEVVIRVGAENVSAVEPSERFVAAARARHPGVSVERAFAEQLPFEDGVFDATLAQLVVHFMADAVVGLREMRRVTRPDGVVAACVWDHAGGRGPLGVFWDAARGLDPHVEDESRLPGARSGHLTELSRAAGLEDVEERLLVVAVEHPTFEEWWEPFTLGVGPAGAYAARLEPDRQDRLRDRCREILPPAPFVVSAAAWAVKGRA
jgi:SAM-dependent methyltransferase